MSNLATFVPHDRMISRQNFTVENKVVASRFDFRHRATDFYRFAKLNRALLKVLRVWTRGEYRHSHRCLVIFASYIRFIAAILHKYWAIKS